MLSVMRSHGVNGGEFLLGKTLSGEEKQLLQSNIIPTL